MTEKDHLPEENLQVEGIETPENAATEPIAVDPIEVVDEQQIEVLEEVELEKEEEQAEEAQPVEEKAEEEEEEEEEEVIEVPEISTEPELIPIETDPEDLQVDLVKEAEVEVDIPALDVIEQESVNSAETEPVHLKEALPPINIDYSGYSRQALLESLDMLITHRTIHDITHDVENIRSTFYKKLKIESEEKHKKFIEEGGAEEEYKPAPDPLEEGFKSSYENFRNKRAEYSKALEGDKEGNLKKKLEILHPRQVFRRKTFIKQRFDCFIEALCFLYKFVKGP